MLCNTFYPIRNDCQSHSQILTINDGSLTVHDSCLTGTTLLLICGLPFGCASYTYCSSTISWKLDPVNFTCHLKCFYGCLSIVTIQVKYMWWESSDCEPLNTSKTVWKYIPPQAPDHHGAWSRFTSIRLSELLGPVTFVVYPTLTMCDHRTREIMATWGVKWWMYVGWHDLFQMQTTLSRTK
jgi:hypothetical protein